MSSDAGRMTAGDVAPGLTGESDRPGDVGSHRCDARAAEDLERYSNHPSAFIALNRDTEHFRVASMPGFIAYRRAGRYLFQLGGVFAPPGTQAGLLREFCAKAERDRQRICALQLRPEDIPIYRDAGFRINQLGLSYTVDLAKFQTAGTRFMKMRNKI